VVSNNLADPFQIGRAIPDVGRGGRLTMWSTLLCQGYNLHYNPIIPPRCRGCLYSIFRCGAGSGGREIRMRRRCGVSARRSKPLRPGAPAARHGASLTVAVGAGQTCGAPCGPKAVDRRPSNSKGEAGRLEGQSTGGDAEQAFKHRARDALGFSGLAVLSVSTSLGVARRRGSRVQLGPWRPARPRFFRGGRLIRRSPPGRRRKKEVGPARGPPKNTGDGARPMAYAPMADREGPAAIPHIDRRLPGAIVMTQNPA